MANETKWTPGPWVAQPDHDSIFIVAGGYPFGSTICEMQTNDREQANADLIAAAPFIFDALCEVAVLGHGKCVIGKPLADMIRTALAKATNSTP